MIKAHNHNKAAKSKSGAGVKMPEFSVLLGAKTDNFDIVKQALLNNPDSINIVDQDYGMTALHWAASHANYQICELILNHDDPYADVWIRDKSNRHAIDYAIELGADELIEQFNKRMFPENYLDHDPFERQAVIVPFTSPSVK